MNMPIKVRISFIIVLCMAAIAGFRLCGAPTNAPAAKTTNAATKPTNAPITLQSAVSTNAPVPLTPQQAFMEGVRIGYTVGRRNPDLDELGAMQLAARMWQASGR